MIGKLINDFENLPSNTVKEFNDIFKDCPLNYPEDYTVEIGEVYGTTRQLLINDNEITHHDFTAHGSRIFNKRKNKPGRKKEVSVFHVDNTLIGNFESVSAAIRELGMDQATFYNYLKQGRIKMEEVA